ncbi:MFS transporter [Rhodococcus koreensis]
MENSSHPATAGGAAEGWQVLAARLDRLPRITKSHRIWMAILGVLFIGDLAELHVLSYSAPAIRSLWGLTVEDIGQLTAMGFAGMFIGAVLGGRLADRFGRRRVLIGATVFYAAGSILCAVAPNPEMLGVFRFLAGVGVQAVTGLLIVFVTELFPRKSRGKMQALMLGIGLLGIPFIATSARFIVPISPESWRWMFVFAAIGLIPAVVAYFKLPESPRWLMLNNRPAEADAIISKLEREAGIDPNDPLPDIAAAPVVGVTKAKMTDLFRGHTRKIVIVAALIMIFDILGFYGFTAWVPTLLVEHGYDISTTLTITTIFSIAPFAGAMVGMAVADRWERKTVSFVLATLSGVCIVGFGFTDQLWLLVVCGFFANLLMQTNTAVIYAYLPEVFPTVLRGLGSGFANGMGRVAGAINGILIAAIFAFGGFAAAFLAAGIFITLQGVIMLCFGERTSGRKLADTTDDPKLDPTGPVTSEARA